jgi:hypothetical protein
MKKAAKKKVEDNGTGVLAVMRALFRTFAKLAEQAGEGRPLLRGLRVARDPKADRIVVVHGESRVEFVLAAGSEGDVPYGQIECRRMDSAGATEKAPIARFGFDSTGVVSQSTVPELVGENIAQEHGAWSVVAAVLWDALQARA